MPRFVILHHELPAGSARASHWDFMLEFDGVLRTWALPQEPAPGRQQVAETLADHRLEYLTYEGPISNKRGRVTQWDAGAFAVVEETDGLLRVELDGGRAPSEVTLTRTPDSAQRWIVAFAASNTL